MAQTPEKTPAQRTIGALAVLLAGYVFLGTLLDSYLNARQLVTRERAAWATAGLMVLWGLVSLRVRLRPFPWVVREQRVWVKRLGIHPTAFLAGVIGLLWLPVLAEWISPTPLPIRQLLTTAELGRIEASLRTVAQPHDKVRFGCPPNDEDACLLAGQLMRAFRAAGWPFEADGVARATLEDPLPGIVLLGPVTIPKGPGYFVPSTQVPPSMRGTEPQDASSPRPGASGMAMLMTPSIIAVEQALASVGLSVRRRVDPTGGVPSGAIHLFVGPHPFEQGVLAR